jgi:hypothetical protein
MLSIHLLFILRRNPRIRLDKLCGTMQLHGQLIAMNEDTRFRLKETVDIF